MTTLPQTTPIRMPRPNGSSPVIAMPGAAGPVPNMMSASPGLSPADAWRVVRGHMWLIAAFVCISGIAGFFINQHLERYYSRYTAIGHIQFQPTMNYDPIHNPNPTIDGGQLMLELATQSQMLKHDSLLTKVLTNPDSEIRKTAWITQFPNIQTAKAELASQFNVTPIAGTRLIMVQMTTPIARDSRTIVEELVQQHINDQRQLATEKQLQRTQLINARAKELKSQQNQRIVEMREKSIRLTQAGWDVGGNGNGRRAEESALSANASALAANIVNAQTRLQTMLDQFGRGEDPIELTNAVEADPNVAYLKNAIDQQDMRTQTQTNDLGPEHPTVKKEQQVRELLNRKLAQTRGEKIAALRKSAVDSLKASISANQQQFESVNTQLEKVKQDVIDLSNVYRQYLVARDEEAQLKVELKEVTDVLDQIAAASKVDNSGVNWSTHPTIPDSPSFPRLSATMTMAIMTGLGLALGIAFLRELTDTSVRSPRDITRIGQLNMLGMVSDINDDAQSAGAKLPLVIFEAPHAILAEQFRQVRTRMQHAASLDSTRSILVTSPGAGDGKSTVACNLAAGLALNGRRILLVDANFRRPELHKVFNLTNDTGFSDVLNQLDTLPQNIRESQVPNLAVLTSGPKPVNATELFESQLLVDFIEKALEEFDHVVFDSGPLLVVSETVALAPRVDGVVTVVRARHNSRGLLIRMRDTMRQLKAEHLGVILNGVRVQGGGYYGRNIKAYYAYDDGRSIAIASSEPSPAA